MQPVRFKNYLFYQSEFKISSDNILFFDFVRLPKRGTAVELGAGFGLGTVILARRYPQTEIIAVEYQRELYELLLKNLRLNDVKNVKPLLCDVRKIEDCLKPQIADAVYSNPPFWRKEYLTEETKKGEVYIKANYEVETSYTDFLKAAKYLLKSSKSFFFMFETQRLDSILCDLKRLKFQPKELQLVYPNNKKPSHVFFVHSVLGGKEGFLKVLPPLFG
jgi:tRNA1Val (adenine37-N6)-methyltransferase